MSNLINIRNKQKEELTRIAIINADKCKPTKCRQECKKSCPVNKTGKICIQVENVDLLAQISENICIGCGICVQKCPFDAISIINLPTNLNKETTHRYGPNSFKLHRLPVPHEGQVLGLVGTNGIGKSTALQILSGKCKPNLGRFEGDVEWTEVINYFKGSTLQNYFKKLSEGNLKTIIKPQYIDQIHKHFKGTVEKSFIKLCDINQSEFENIYNQFDLKNILAKQIETLSGGELQRFMCAITCGRHSDIYMFDEPSSFLDIKQRIKVAIGIRNLIKFDNYIIVVEHDLSILDFLSDYVCLLYGSPGHYGVVTHPSTVANGINHFMDGFIPSENMRFRDHALSFDITEKDESLIKSMFHYKYSDLIKTYDKFELRVEAGSFNDSEIIVMLGENGTGKTTFVRMLAGDLEPNENGEIPKLNVSYKPQKISFSFDGNVEQYLMNKIGNILKDSQFKSDVLKPLNIPELMDKEINTLSGGEFQRVEIASCLGKQANIYLIDEPSAYLDAEQRLNTAKVIKRFVRNSKKTAFVVEHDFLMATYLADRVIVFDGVPSIKARASPPQSVLIGVNSFLKSLNVTFRRDRKNLRPRINKLNGARDIEQKKSGNYFFLE